MAAYILRRILLMIPTLFGILLLNFVIVQFAPGGPVEQTLAQLQGLGVDAGNRIGAGAQSDMAAGSHSGEAAATAAPRDWIRLWLQRSSSCTALTVPLTSGS